MLLGLSSLCPAQSSLSRVVTGTPAYGTPPHVNTSQHVTPNDHYGKTLLITGKFRSMIKEMQVATI